MTRLPEGNPPLVYVYVWPPADGPQSLAQHPTWHLAVVLFMTASVKTVASGWHEHQRRYLAFERIENLKHFPWLPVVTRAHLTKSALSDETRR